MDFFRLGLLAALQCAVVGSPSTSLAEQRTGPRVGVHLDKAETYFEAGDFPAAVREYDAAILIAGPTERLLSLRGGAKFRVGDYRGADTDLTRAIKLNPKDAALFLLRGLSRSLLKPPDRKGTCNDFERARLLGANIREVAKGVDEWCATVDQ